MRNRRYSYNKRPTRVGGRFYAILGIAFFAASALTVYKLDMLPKQISLPSTKQLFENFTPEQWVYQLKDMLSPPKEEEDHAPGSMVDPEEAAEELAIARKKNDDRIFDESEPTSIIAEEREALDQGLKQRALPELIVTRQVETQIQDQIPLSKKLTSDEQRELLIQSIISKTGVSASEVAELTELVLKTSSQYNFDPLFVTAFIMTESSFRADVVSHNGKYGLMQIDAFRGAYVAKLAKMQWDGEQALLDPAYNVKMGLGYFAFITKILKGDQRLALMAYAFGPRSFLNAVRVKSELPESVYAFADKVLALHKKY
ncbi:MAG: transglycosylase SLT domain-containing protein, partial [Bdellovibrionales bacterium]|nr:transglycosylase SLT domain-containing protein [Bdellovibrionales bacterium]